MIHKAPVDFVNDPYVAGKQAGGHQLDRSDHAVASEWLVRQISGVGGQVDFVGLPDCQRRQSHFGLSSITKRAYQNCSFLQGPPPPPTCMTSNILLPANGIANLRLKNNEKRARALIHAHPSVQDELIAWHELLVRSTALTDEDAQLSVKSDPLRTQVHTISYDKLYDNDRKVGFAWRM